MRQISSYCSRHTTKTQKKKKGPRIKIEKNNDKETLFENTVRAAKNRRAYNILHVLYSMIKFWGPKKEKNQEKNYLTQEEHNFRI